MKGKPYYRCSATRPDYATPAVPGHPPSYSVREEGIVAKLETWLTTLGQPDQVDASVRSILTADKSTGGFEQVNKRITNTYGNNRNSAETSGGHDCSSDQDQAK